jgi:hypothetical protein
MIAQVIIKASSANLEPLLPYQRLETVKEATEMSEFIPVHK